MTPEQIAKAREIIAAATPGPWKDDVTDSYGIDWHIDGPPCEDLKSRKGGYLPVAKSMRSGDAEFCAAARTGWPEALDEVERLQKWNDRPDAALKEFELNQLRAEIERLQERFIDSEQERIRWENKELRAEIERLHRFIKEQGGGLAALEAVAEAAESFCHRGICASCEAYSDGRLEVLEEALKAWREK